MNDFGERISEYKRKDGSNLRFFACCLFIFLWLTAFIGANRTFFYYIEVDGSSMRDTLYSGEVLLAEKNAPFSYGSVVIIDNVKQAEKNGRPVYDEDGNPVYECLIKRVIGMSGDVIVIENGSVSRNGVLLEEPYAKGNTFVANSPARKEYRIPEGEVFFLGDNREDSKDSRAEEFGTCKEEDIVGVVPDWAMSPFMKWFSGARAAVSEWLTGLFG